MHVRRIVTVMTVTLAVTLAFGQCSPWSPDAKKAHHRERGLAYFEKGRFQEAVIEFKNVLQIDPKDADAHYRLALAHLKLGGLPDLQAAFGELQRTVEIDPGNRDAQLKLGELYLLSRDPAKARKHADLILASAPTDTDGLVLRGRSLIGEEQFEQGIAELKKAIERDPKNIRIYLDLAEAFVRMKDWQSAEATLQQALAADPQSLEARLSLGDLRLRTGQPDRAEVEYKRAIEMASDNDLLYLKLARFYQLIRKWDEAEATYKQLAARKETDEKPRIFLGDFYTEIGERGGARDSYLRALELNPDSVAARDKLIAHDLDAGNLREAEPRIQAILQKNAGDLAGRFFDGRLRLARGKPDDAIEVFQQVLKEEPQSALVHHFMGLAFAQKNDVAQARRELGEAVRLNRTLAETRLALAAIYLAEGAYDLAIEEAQAAIRLRPRSLQAAGTLGDAYLRKGDLAQSKRVFEAIIKVAPNEPLSHYRLGLIARSEKNHEQALAHFEGALAANPRFIDALFQIAAIRLAQGNQQGARERVARQLASAPDEPLIHNLLGRLWMQANDPDSAEEAFKKAIALNPALPVSYMNLAELYSRTGRLDRAAREYETALAKNPKLVTAHALLGIIHERCKELCKAGAHYRDALKLNPKFAPAANNLAWIYGEQDREIDAALELAQTAREQLPQDPNIADTLGWLYYKKHAYLRAIGLLKESAEKLPDNPVVQYHLGMAYLKNGDETAAKRTLRHALTLGRNFSGAEEVQRVLSEL